jgi:hypothetical protein
MRTTHDPLPPLTRQDRFLLALLAASQVLGPGILAIPAAVVARLLVALGCGSLKVVLPLTRVGILLGCLCLIYGRWQR